MNNRKYKNKWVLMMIEFNNEIHFMLKIKWYFLIDLITEITIVINNCRNCNNLLINIQ